MAVSINAFGDCETGSLGSGLAACDTIDLDDINGFVAFRKGWSKAITNGVAAFDSTVYKNDIKALDAFPYLGVYDFTQDTPDNEEATSSSQVLSEVRVAKPVFGFNFDKGTCLHKSLWDKRAPNGGIWDFGLMTNTHIILAVNSDETKLEAFDGGMLSVASYKFKQGSDPQSSMAKFQLLNAVQFNKRLVALPFTKTGDLDINGAIETQVTTDAVSAGTTFSVSVVSKCNTDNPILDLDDTSKWALGGTQASATTISGIAYNASTKKYDFTVDTALVASDTVQPKLSDGTYNVVEDTIGNMFKGESASQTVS